MKSIFRKRGGQRIALISIGTGLLLASAVLITWFLLRGQTTVAGDFDESEHSTSLNCAAKNFLYPYFKIDNAEGAETEIIAVFTDNGKKIESIALTQKMYYESDDAARGSEATNHAMMNESFGTLLGADALNVNYYSGDKTMRMQIYAKGKDYNLNTRKYFLINTTSEKMSDIEENYIEQGFKCDKIVNK